MTKNQLRRWIHDDFEKGFPHPMVEYICNLYEPTKQQEEAEPLSDQQRMQTDPADEPTNINIREVGTQMFKM